MNFETGIVILTITYYSYNMQNSNYLYHLKNLISIYHFTMVLESNIISSWNYKKRNSMITVLRIGHRPERDKRITTHIGLVARAFNANQLLIDTKDTELEQTIEGVVSRFGGTFQVISGIKWRNIIRDWDGIIIHLTMYGEHLDEIINEIPKSPENELLVVIGSTKVPREVYDKADYNIAIGHQPHSEVAALALFLDRYFKGEELKKDFKGKVQILSSRKGKNVIETEQNDSDKP